MPIARQFRVVVDVLLVGLRACIHEVPCRVAQCHSGHYVAICCAMLCSATLYCAVPLVTFRCVMYCDVTYVVLWCDALCCAEVYCVVRFVLCCEVR